LLGPYELFGLGDGEAVGLRVRFWERGTMLIRPRGSGASVEREVPVLRVHVGRELKPAGLPYWDITQKTLAAQLLPLLAMPRFQQFEYVITKHGSPPKSRFTVEKVPL